jgi:hypothetical protein
MGRLKREATKERGKNTAVTKAKVFMAALSRPVVAAMRELRSFPT